MPWGLITTHLDIDTTGNNGNEPLKLLSDKYGVFLNDTLSVGDFSVTPGIRYDRMRPVNDFFSPSLGVAWNPTDKITLRAYGARGYGLPMLADPAPARQRFTPSRQVWRRPISPISGSRPPSSGTSCPICPQHH